MARIEHGDLDKWYGVTNGDVFTDASEYTKYGLSATHWVGYKYILDQFKTVKVCPNNACLPGDFGTGASSYNKIYHRLDGTEQQLILGSGNSITANLQNGMAMRIYYGGGDCSAPSAVCSIIGFDISGGKSQNIICKDYFEFNVQADKVATRGDIESITSTSCTTYIIQNNNMDYLDE